MENTLTKQTEQAIAKSFVLIQTGYWHGQANNWSKGYWTLIIMDGSTNDYFNFGEAFGGDDRVSDALQIKGFTRIPTGGNQYGAVKLADVKHYKSEEAVLTAISKI